MNAGIKDYGGDEGKITGWVNVRGAWDWDRGRIPKASRRNGGRGMTQKRHKKNDGAKKSTSLELAHETKQLNQIGH